MHIITIMTTQDIKNYIFGKNEHNYCRSVSWIASQLCFFIWKNISYGASIKDRIN